MQISFVWSGRRGEGWATSGINVTVHSEKRRGQKSLRGSVCRTPPPRKGLEPAGRPRCPGSSALRPALRAGPGTRVWGRSGARTQAPHRAVPTGHRDPHELLCETTAEPVRQGHQRHRVSGSGRRGRVACLGAGTWAWGGGGMSPGTRTWGGRRSSRMCRLVPGPEPPLFLS